MMTKPPLRLLPSSEGRIDQLLIVFPGITTAATWAEYEAILEVFDPKGTVIIFKQEDPNVRIQVIPQSMRHINWPEIPPTMGKRLRDIHEVNNALNINQLLRNWERELSEYGKRKRVSYPRWAQDPFCILYGDSQTLLLQSLHTQRLSDLFLALHLAEDPKLDLSFRPTRLSLEGGNILATHDRVYIGKDLVQQNQTLLGIDESAVLELFRSVFAIEEIVVVGYKRAQKKLFGSGATSYQPLFHIDLFLTLGGLSADGITQKVFIASPSLAFDLLQSATASSTSLLEELITVPTMEQRQAFQDIKAAFCHGEEIVEIPIYFLEGTTYSWNNALVENYGGKRRIFLPSYQSEHDATELLNPIMQVLEAAIQSIFTMHGFEVVWLKAGKFFRILASFGGSLHCATKILRRSFDT